MDDRVLKRVRGSGAWREVSQAIAMYSEHHGTWPGSLRQLGDWLAAFGHDARLTDSVRTAALKFEPRRCAVGR